MTTGSTLPAVSTRHRRPAMLDVHQRQRKSDVGAAVVLHAHARCRTHLDRVAADRVEAIPGENSIVQSRGEVYSECVHKALPAILSNTESRTSNCDEPSSIRIPPLRLLRPCALREPESSTATLDMRMFDARLTRMGKPATCERCTPEISKPSTRSARIPLPGYHIRKAFSGGAISIALGAVSRLPSMLKSRRRMFFAPSIARMARP